MLEKEEIEKIAKIKGYNLKSIEKDYLLDYNQGKIKCAACNKVLGPKSKEKLVLWAVFVEEEIKFVCRELECYEKALREKWKMPGNIWNI